MTEITFLTGSEPAAISARWPGNWTVSRSPSTARQRQESAKGRDMARALLGHLPTTADRHLIEENARLKARLREVEGELAELREAFASHQLLDELHRITSAASALA